VNKKNFAVPIVWTRKRLSMILFYCWKTGDGLGKLKIFLKMPSAKYRQTTVTTLSSWTGKMGKFCFLSPSLSITLFLPPLLLALPSLFCLHSLASFACTLARLSQSFSLALFLARAPQRARSLSGLSSSRSRCHSHSYSHSHSLSLWLVCIWCWIYSYIYYLYSYYLCACVRACVCVRVCVYANVRMRAFLFLFSGFFSSLCVITCVSVFQVASESDSACTSACQCVCARAPHLQRQWWCVPFEMV